MFMRISWGRVKPGRWEEYESRYRAMVTGLSVGPLPKQRWLLRDLDNPDAGYAVSLWDNEADMRAYSQDPEVRKRIEAEFGDLFTGEYTTKLCQVRHEYGPTSQ
jgi:heme-degrading monooxygenase HmoA